MEQKIRKRFRYGCFSGFFFAGLGIFGFIMLMKGCLSKYDQHFKFTKAVVTGSEGQDIIFTLVQNRKTTSYSRGSGINYTEYNTTIWARTFDLNTGKELQKKKIINISKVKNHPVQVWGAAGGKIWCFINELKAYDPGTLEEVVNIQTLEKMHADMKGKFPAESQFYQPHIAEGYIIVTAKNGVDYSLNLESLDCTPYSDQTTDQKTEIQDQLKTLQEKLNSWADEMRKNAHALRDKEITMAEYQNRETQRTKENDSIRHLLEELELQQQAIISGIDNRKRMDQLFSSSFGIALNDITKTSDSLNGQWYGLVNEKESSSLSDYFRINDNYEATKRNAFYTCALVTENRNVKLNLSTLQRLGTSDFLQGGFMLNPASGNVLCLSGPESFLVLHRDVIGKEGKLLVSRVDMTGNILWNAETGIPADMQDLILYKNKLVIFGTTNSDLTSGEANTMVILNLDNGEVNVYDYMSRSAAD